ncbi:hypothetical protein H9L13_05260 [Sphingomonas lutea]|uniref:Uncharacterized protein n=1 Tax=Sphingomonas lutea TaxID=1045317 RepID=A0A7G9SKA7_9SPHN|nr:hypothetical protein [Sphingomonas lutea]QNN68282.1 hypothetical protein H9L13_05260 [Sphingomonas lutea]
MEPTATPVRRAPPATGGDESGVAEVTLNLPPPPPPIEYPAHARRDPWSVGALQPQQHGLGANPWRAASGAFLSTLMRRMQTPIASRWAHMGMRQALLAEARAPRDVHPVDWVAERAWLLLRMGEADAARMLIAGVDTDRFTPKMTQVAVQSALASSDPPALCPIEGRIGRHETRVRALVEAICASLAGEPESAAAQIDQARRFGRIGGIDLVLAEKVVGAGANTGRAVTVEWEPVEHLTAWRYGLATATGMTLPERLMGTASPQLHAFYARAPLLTAEDRLKSAHIATGLGVFSSQSLIDLYATIYDTTDPGDLPETDAWQLRQAFVARNADARLAALRRVLGNENDTLEREAHRALVARAATLVQPDAALASDAPELISAMLTAGYDRHAARWANAVQQMDDANADRAWAMLALAAPNAEAVDISYGRITSFIDRDQSRRKQRSALLVAGLAGLGRINERSAVALNLRYGLGLGRSNSWTRMIRAAARRGQPGTVLVLTGTGFQGQTLDRLPAAYMYRSLQALTRTGQDFSARMIAAEALSRT